MEKKRDHQIINSSHKVGNILGTEITSTDTSGVIRQVSEYLKSGHKFFIVTPNPEIITRASRDLELREILNNADISVPDGVGIKLVSRVLRIPQPTIIPGRKLMLKLFSLADEKKYKVFLLGSSKETIKLCTKKFKDKYPSVSLMANAGPLLSLEAKPIDDQEELIQNDTIRDINNFKPDLLFIAFGSPKQEKWFDLHRKKMKVGGAMVVGGSLDYFAGRKPTPPDIVSKLGFEWLWRLLLEPGHIKRAFVATVVFPTSVVLQRFRNVK